MMQEIKEKLKTVGYAKRNSSIEKRLNKYFNQDKLDAENQIINDTMQQIGKFQMPENRLDHIKNYRKVLEQGEKTKLIKEKQKQKRESELMSLLSKTDDDL